MIILNSRVISFYDKKTSMRLTNIEWNILEKICFFEHLKRKSLLEMIYSQHCPKLNMTSAVRLFIQLYLFYRLQNSENGEDRAETTLAQTLTNIS